MKTPPVSENEATSAAIDAWLSGRATRAERRKISNAIKNDPAAARTLAEQARTEADLARVKRGDRSTAALREILYGTEKSTLFQRKARRLGNALAALAAVVGAFGIWWQLRSTNATDSTATARRTVVNVEQVIPAAIPDQPAEAPVEEAGEPDDEMQRLLARYRLPDGAGFKGEKVSLRAAAAMIERAIHQANLLKNPAVRAFRIRVKSPENLPDDRFVHFRAGAVSAGNLLQAVATLTDSSLSWETGKAVITMRRIPETIERGKPITRVYRVAPDFLTRVIPPPPLTEEEQAQAADPFLPAEERIAPFTPDINAVRDEFARACGLEFPEGSRLEFAADTGRLILSSTQRDLDRAESMLECLYQETAPQVFLTTKFIDLPDHIQVKDRIVGDAEFQMLMRELSQTPGVDLMTAPSLIVRDGQSSKIEVTKDVPQPNGLTDWTGIQVPVKAVVTGEVIALEAVPLRREQTENGIQPQEVELSASLADRQTAVFMFPSAVPGRQLVGTVTATLLDPSGQPLNPSPAPAPTLEEMERDPDHLRRVR